MMINFHFTDDFDLGSVISFLASHSGSAYPDFVDWLDKVSVELGMIKRGIFCYEYTRLVGLVLFQKHKMLADFLELKNLTVLPGFNGRYVASFLLRNAEIEGEKIFRVNNIICDAKKNDIPITNFLLFHKYDILGHQDLYGLGAGLDNVFMKVRRRNVS